MPFSLTQSGSTAESALRSTPYEATKVGRPPIPITVAPTPSSAQPDLHPSLRPPRSPASSVEGPSMRYTTNEDGRRDSGMAPSHSTTRDSHTTSTTDIDLSHSIKKSRSLPRLAGGKSSFQKPQATRGLLRKWSVTKIRSSNTSIPESPRSIGKHFRGLSTSIPTISFEDLASPDNIQFSKRGSVLIGGRRVSETYGNTDGKSRGHLGQEERSTTAYINKSDLAEDDEALSRKVRSMYENDAHFDQAEPPVMKWASGGIEAAELQHTDSHVNDSRLSLLVQNNLRLSPPDSSNPQHAGRRKSRSQWELAGGLEDWEDINGDEVDRYGFISRNPIGPKNTSSNSLPSSPPTRLHRVSTALQLASEAPRRQHSRLGRSTSVTKSTRTGPNNNADKNTRLFTRPLSSQSSYRSTSSMGASRLRHAANRLPYNKQRRLLDEAGDMLTLPPGLADIAEFEEGGKATDTLKRKEWEREAKWRKMAKPKQGNQHGGGMVFTFDTENPKLIERTWKGIPDKWRATAWHAFLSSSARKVPGSVSDEELVKSFHELLGQSSPDDVQIDIDVPRTINGHVMFRKRYRGGQRLLFRVLHSLSLYFPETGYVQGMAALAATLLCYFDEEMTFVMLVRMWQLRGLERLYQLGFQGLMQALQEFEEKWLKNGEIGSKLSELGITSTAYGTRWYLTVFNYSIPFPAQLRVWDVFMLLGDRDSVSSAVNPSSFHGQLDVLHATSTALIDATREILLDSDFENAMKVLTSWIPIRDEDMLLEVAKAEWRACRKMAR